MHSIGYKSALARRACRYSDAQPPRKTDGVLLESELPPHMRGKVGSGPIQSEAPLQGKKAAASLSSVPLTAPKIRFCPSAVNGPAQIRQSPKIVPSFLYKTAPASCYGNRGGSYTLLVLSQALTQLLAGILDSSLSGCQNCRAFAVAMCFPFNKPYFQRMALYFVLFHRVNLILQFAVTAHDLSHHAV